MKHIIKNILAVVLLCSITIPAFGGDVDFYVVVKGQNLRQTNSGAPIVVTNEFPYRFIAEVFASTTNGVTNAIIKLPTKTQTNLVNQSGEDEAADFVFETGYTNKGQIDKAFPAKGYTFVISTLNDGTNTATMTIPKDAYPVAPHIANLPDAQEIEASLPFVLQWDRASNIGTNDLVLLDISETNGSQVLTTPGFFQPGSLNGTNIAILINSNQLDADKLYDAQLLFIKVSSRNTNAIPGSIGVAGYFRQTKFPLGALPEPVSGSRVQFSSYNYNVNETDSEAAVTVTRTGDVGSSTSVNLVTSDGTALEGTNYQAVSTTLTFAPDVMTTNIGIPIVNDYKASGKKLFNVWLNGLTGNSTYGNRSNAVVTITDAQNVTAGVLQFLKSSNGVSEASASVPLTISRSGTAGAVSLHFHTVAGSAKAGTDYVATNGTLFFPDKSKSAILPIGILSDSLNESNETFYVVLDSTTGGASLGTNTMTMVNIIDNDPSGQISVASASYTTNENSGFFLVSIKRTGTGTLSSNASVDFTTVDGTATAGIDYVATNGTVTFGSNELVKTVEVHVNNDTVAEGDETISFRISNPQGAATLGLVTNAPLVIKDDESSISISNSAVSVNESGTNVAITLVRSGALLTSVSVDFTTVNGTATAGSDYRATNGTLTFPANTSTKTILIAITNDAVIENNETFSFRISNPQGGVQLGSITNEVVTILNDDTAGTFRFSSSSYSGTEGGVATISVQRTGGSASGVTVYLSMVNGTASSSDYVNASQTLTFAAGETNKNILVSLNTDVAVESTETVNLSLTSPSSGATIGSPSSAVLNINNAAAITCNPGSFNLTAQGMKASGFTATMVSGSIAYTDLTITGIQAGTTTKTIIINLADIPPGTTGSFPMTSGGDFFGYSISTVNVSTLCTSTKTYNSSSPSTGCINITEWDTANKIFKATFQFTCHGEDAGTTCNGVLTSDPIPTDSPSITSGQVWVNYY